MGTHEGLDTLHAALCDAAAMSFQPYWETIKLVLLSSSKYNCH
jgi:hypothetical protein